MTKTNTKPRAKKTPAAPVDDRLRIEYVLLDQVLQWERNPKKHDAGAIWQSIEKHGFKDPPKFEPKLNDGKGGFVEGNGRSHILKEMRLANEPAPRGIVATSTGEWLMPVLFGVDAASELAAEAYGVDHNNLVLAGGDFSNTDIAKLWDESVYATLLADLANQEELPVSVDGEDVDDLIARITSDSGSSSANASGDTGAPGAGAGGSVNLVPDGDRYKEQYAVIVMCENEEQQRETYDALHAEGYKLKVVST